MPKPFQTKFAAAFLLLFVCLNAGGAVCVAYCRSVVLNAKSDHCPLAKQERHCDKTKLSEDNGPALAATKFDCCPMLVSFVPGTLEPNQRFNVATAAVPASDVPSTPAVEIPRFQFHIIPAYRGPPKDGSVIHNTNRTLRI
jgi:hypothetical protein